MKIKFPKRYSKYIDAMFDVSILMKESDLILLFKLGMDDVVNDLKMGAGEFPPDMDKSLLFGEQIELDIPYELSEDEMEIVEGIRKHYKIDRDTVLMTFILMGLFLQWSLLKNTERYQKDLKFRKLIDEMPHDLVFEECARASL